MGIFRNLDQPGPGVYVEDTKEGPVVRFFRFLALKFFTLCLSNMLFVVLNIPMVALALVMSSYLLPIINPIFIFDNFVESIINVSGGVADGDITMVAEQMYFSYMLIGALFLLALGLVVIGPVQSAFVFVYRNYARAVPSFYWEDFFKSLKVNWKKSIFVTIFTAVVSIILLFNIGFYLTIYTGRFSQALAAVFITFFLVFLCVHHYVYPLLVSLELSLFKIYRNALIFAVIRLVPTLGIILLQIVVAVLIPFLLIFLAGNIGIGIAGIMYVGFVFAFCQYLGTFFAWEQIDRFILAPAQAKEEEEALEAESLEEIEGEDENDESDLDDIDDSEDETR